MSLRSILGKIGKWKCPQVMHPRRLWLTHHHHNNNSNPFNNVTGFYGVRELPKLLSWMLKRSCLINFSNLKHHSANVLTCFMYLKRALKVKCGKEKAVVMILGKIVLSGMNIQLKQKKTCWIYYRFEELIWSSFLFGEVREIVVF